MSYSPSTTGNVASGATDSGNPVKIGAIYHASPVTVTDGQRVDSQSDPNGALIVNTKPLAQGIDSINVYQHGASYANMSASGLVLTGAGKIAGLWVSSASSTPTIIVYDNTAASGTTVLASFTPVSATMYLFPWIRVLNGIYVSLGGTVNCTVFFDSTTG